MRTLVTAIAVASALTACGSASTSPADALASDDGAAGSAPYATAVDRLAAKCSQSPDQLVGMVEKTRSLLSQGGVTENNLSVLQHAARSIPAGQHMDCIGVLAAYATLRTGGK